MPTGLTNSPTLFPSNIPNKSNQAVPQGAINITLSAVITTTGVPKQCVPYTIPPQASVNVRGSSANSAPVFVGLTPEELANGGGRRVTPDTEIFYPVDNAGQIWVSGNAGDGIQVTITANPVY